MAGERPIAGPELPKKGSVQTGKSSVVDPDKSKAITRKKGAKDK